MFQTQQFVWSPLTSREELLSQAASYLSITSTGSHFVVVVVVTLFIFLAKWRPSPLGEGKHLPSGYVTLFS